MKLKVFATLALFAVAAGTQAANVSINDITVFTGTPTVTVPILISPDNAAETIGGMNISFAAGQLADAIAIMDADPGRSSIGTPEEFDGSIWDLGGGFFGASGTPAVHSVFSGVARVGSPFQITPDGIVITYTLDTSSLAPGLYELNPNFQVAGVGSSADTALTFDSGVLNIQIPEPSTVVLSAIFSVLGLGVFIKRRRG